MGQKWSYWIENDKIRLYMGWAFLEITGLERPSRPEGNISWMGYARNL